MKIGKIARPGFVFDGTDWIPFTGPAGPPGPGISMKGEVPDGSYLPATHPPDPNLKGGDAYVLQNTNHLWVYNAEQQRFEDMGQFKGPKGDPGQTLTIHGAVNHPGDLPVKPEPLAVYMATGGKAGAEEPGHLYFYNPDSPSASGAPHDPVYDPPAGYVDVGRIAGPQGIQGIQGVQGPIGASAHFIPSVASFTALPAAGNPGELCITENNGHVYSWNVAAARWEDGGQIRVDGHHAHLGVTMGTATDLNPIIGTPGEWRMVEDTSEIFGWDVDTHSWVSAGRLKTMPDGAHQGDILYWDENLREWLTQPHRLGDEINVIVNEDYGVPVYDQDNDTYEVRRLNMGDLGDGPGALVPENGQALVFEDGFWVPQDTVSEIAKAKDYQAPPAGTGDTDYAAIVWSNALGKFTLGHPETAVYDWTDTTIYDEGALVSHNGDVYLLKHANSLNMEPGTNQDLAHKHWMRVSGKPVPWMPGKVWRAGDVVMVQESNDFLTGGSVHDYDGVMNSSDPIHLWVATGDMVNGVPAVGNEPMSINMVPPGYCAFGKYPAQSGFGIIGFDPRWKRLDTPRLWFISNIHDMIGGKDPDSGHHFTHGDLGVILDSTASPVDQTWVWEYKVEGAGWDPGLGFWRKTAHRWPAPPIPLAADKGMVLTVEEDTSDPRNTIYRGVWKPAAGGLQVSGSNRDDSLIHWVGDAATGHAEWIDPPDSTWYIHLSQTINGVEFDRKDADKALSARIDGVVSGLTHKDPVKSKGVNTPPANPLPGDEYIIGTNPTGEWGGHVNQHATWDGTKWVIEAPQPRDTRMAEDTQIMWNWNGTAWVNVGKAGAQRLHDLQDVDVTTALANKDLLTWSDPLQKWVNHSLSVFEAGELKDVDYSTPPRDKQFLIYNFSTHKWEPKDFRLSINDLGDVIVDHPAKGDFIQWDPASQEWRNRPMQADLNDLHDVEVTGVKDGEILTYDAGSKHWLAKPPAGGGAAAPTGVQWETLYYKVGENAVDGNAQYTIDMTNMAKHRRWQINAWFGEGIMFKMGCLGGGGTAKLKGFKGDGTSWSTTLGQDTPFDSDFDTTAHPLLLTADIMRISSKYQAFLYTGRIRLEGVHPSGHTHVLDGRIEVPASQWRKIWFGTQRLADHCQFSIEVLGLKG